MFEKWMSAVVLLCAHAGLAATINVPADYATIQDAIDASVDGDEILVAPGTYTSTGDEVINPGGRAITIRGTGTAAETILDGEGQRRVVTIASAEGADTVIKGLTITGGWTSGFGGGGFMQDSSPTLTACIIKDCSASSGGGLYGIGSNPTLADCTITGNIATGALGQPTGSGGGMFCDGGGATLTDCMIADNSAALDGGGLRMGSLYNITTEVQLTRCTITGNSCGELGGGLTLVADPLMALYDCLVENNTAGTKGGGVAVGGTLDVDFTGCTIIRNTAIESGGGFYLDAGPTSGWVRLEFTAVCDNTPDQIVGSYDGTWWIDGGGNTISDGSCSQLNVPADYPTIQAAIDASFDGDEIWVAAGTYTGTGDWVINPNGKAISIRALNSAEDTILDGQGQRRVVMGSGGGGDAVIDGFTITGGLADNGGGVFCYSSGLSLANCIIKGNTATSLNYGGGGLYCNGGSPRLDNCTVSFNTADNGGGIHSNASSIVMMGCTIVDNNASWGGGVYAYQGSPTMTYCTIERNTASDQGGGVHVRYATASVMNNLTVSDNTGEWGGGIYFAQNSPTLDTCIIARNTAGVAGGGVCSGMFSNPTLTNSIVCGNSPSQFLGDWTDGGDNAINEVCPVYYVPGDYATIQAAIDASLDGYEIVVAPGTYTGIDGWVINPFGKVITIRATGSADETILDGQGQRRVVMCGEGEGGGTVIEGFTITGGSAEYGAGIFCYASSPTFSNCVVVSNNATDSEFGGGGLCCYTSSPSLSDCVIKANSAANDGGGIFSGESSSPSLTNSTVCGNDPNQIVGSWSDNGGNAIAASCGPLNVPADYATIQDAIDASFDGDEILVAPGTYMGVGDWVINPGGRAIAIRATGTAAETILTGQGQRRVVLCSGGEGVDTVIDGFTLRGGSADNGGGVFLYLSSPTLNNCTISGNTATSTEYGGGGVYCNNSTPAMSNCTIVSNAAANDGGGIYCFDSDPTLSGCTIATNIADNEGGGMYNNGPSNPALTNTEVCGNAPDQMVGTWVDNGGNTVAEECVSYCPDISGDGSVDMDDLLIMLAAWGTDDPAADLTGDGTVDMDDLLVLLGAWGPCAG